eukprot:1155124-Pelagomonas_calceolata.AAC.5
MRLTKQWAPWHPFNRHIREAAWCNIGGKEEGSVLKWGGGVCASMISSMCGVPFLGCPVHSSGSAMCLFVDAVGLPLNALCTPQILPFCDCCV